MCHSKEKGVYKALHQYWSIEYSSTYCQSMIVYSLLQFNGMSACRMTNHPYILIWYRLGSCAVCRMAGYGAEPSIGKNQWLCSHSRAAPSCGIISCRSGFTLACSCCKLSFIILTTLFGVGGNPAFLGQFGHFLKISSLSLQDTQLTHQLDGT